MEGRLLLLVREGCFDGLAVLKATVALAEWEKVRGAVFNDLKQVVRVQRSVAIFGGSDDGTGGGCWLAPPHIAGEASTARIIESLACTSRLADYSACES